MLGKIKCLFGYHKFGYVARLSRQTHMLACHRCRKRFAMNTDVRCVLEWDQELEDLYMMLGGKQ